MYCNNMPETEPKRLICKSINLLVIQIRNTHFFYSLSQNTELDCNYESRTLDLIRLLIHPKDSYTTLFINTFFFFYNIRSKPNKHHRTFKSYLQMGKEGESVAQRYGWSVERGSSFRTVPGVTARLAGTSGAWLPAARAF